MQYVYVLNKHGEPLMPCSPRKARLLLKQKKACVVKRTPFTIKLLYGSTGYKQPITLGVDAGSKHIGISAATEKYELYCEEATPAMMWLICFLHAVLSDAAGETAKPVTVRRVSTTECIASIRAG